MVEVSGHRPDEEPRHQTPNDVPFDARLGLSLLHYPHNIIGTHHTPFIEAVEDYQEGL